MGTRHEVFKERGGYRHGGWACALENGTMERVSRGFEHCRTGTGVLRHHGTAVENEDRGQRRGLSGFISLSMYRV